MSIGMPAISWAITRLRDAGYEVEITTSAVYGFRVGSGLFTERQIHDMASSISGWRAQSQPRVLAPPKP